MFSPLSSRRSQYRRKPTGRPAWSGEAGRRCAGAQLSGVSFIGLQHFKDRRRSTSINMLVRGGQCHLKPVSQRIARPANIHSHSIPLLDALGAAAGAAQESFGNLLV
jgi:hypothetical protein